MICQCIFPSAPPYDLSRSLSAIYLSTLSVHVFAVETAGLTSATVSQWEVSSLLRQWIMMNQCVFDEAGIWQLATFIHLSTPSATCIALYLCKTLNILATTRYLRQHSQRSQPDRLLLSNCTMERTITQILITLPLDKKLSKPTHSLSNADKRRHFYCKSIGIMA